MPKNINNNKKSYTYDFFQSVDYTKKNHIIVCEFAIFDTQNSPHSHTVEH